MKNIDFIGRRHEKKLLDAIFRKNTPSLVVINGRRRIGKSRLIAEFAENHTFYKFTGLAPSQGVTAQTQRDHFALRLAQQTGLPEIKTDDWSKLFSLFNERVKQGRVIILLDEITWMARGDHSFLSKLHSAWENEFKQNHQVILVLCGSVSWWIEKNLLSSTGYFGRVSLRMTLREMPIHDSSALIRKTGFKGSAYEQLILLNVMGGIPWYIEQIDKGQSAYANIKRLCFSQDGLLVDEFERIFHDLFGSGRYAMHTKIVQYLAQGSAEYEQIAAGIQYASSGALSEYLNELEASGFICRDYTWQLKTGSLSSLSRYRLSDNYLRFYLKYIAPRVKQIQSNKYKDIDVAALPGWETMMGLQLENLLVSNRDRLLEALSLKPGDIVQDNPFFQRKTKVVKGCQIDYLIQTKFKALYIIEIKFSRQKIGGDVIKQMQEKIQRLSVPRGFACLPVLIVVGGVTSAVLEAEYFVQIIDVCDWLQN